MRFPSQRGKFRASKECFILPLYSDTVTSLDLVPKYLFATGEFVLRGKFENKHIMPFNHIQSTFFSEET